MGATPEDQDFTLWPGTLGLAATGDVALIRDFAEKSRAEWVASGLRKGYMYMADTVTDPRWFRTNGTFGEDPAFNAEAIAAVVQGFQGEGGLGRDGVALTTKHFPGGGARENGFDPHYAEGQFNVYPTPGSLQTYHLPPFQAAIDAGTSSVMPYYAIPSDEKSAMPQPPLRGLRTGRLRLQQTHSRPAAGDGAPRLHQLRLGHPVEDGVGRDRAERARTGRQGRHRPAPTSSPTPTTSARSARRTCQGLFSTERLDEAARLLTEEMFALGLFDNPYVDPDEGRRGRGQRRVRGGRRSGAPQVRGADEEPRRHAAADRRPAGGPEGVRRALRVRPQGGQARRAAPRPGRRPSRDRVHHRLPVRRRGRRVPESVHR